MTASVSKTENEIRRSLQDFIEKNGAFTAFRVHLGEGVYTREGIEPDRRLRCFVQAVADLAGKPLDQLRILDLACLEGHYAVEFALHGARAVGIEIREANLSKARFLKDQLGIDNVEFFQDDVRNLSEAKYGRFDVVLCAGLLYHLDSPAVFELIDQISGVCDRLAIFETFVSLKPTIHQVYEGKTYWGAHYVEHAETARPQDKYADLWASIDNARSFWLTKPSLCNALDHAGFTSVFVQLNPSLATQPLDRHTFIAIKGQTARILSSPPTDQEVGLNWTEKRKSTASGPPNIERGMAWRLAKKHFPQPVKNVIKKTMRGLGLMEHPQIPDFRLSLPRDPKPNELGNPPE
jgi:ubiquinone/menaquinone biosynthesis C-methylase UbiE